MLDKIAELEERIAIMQESMETLEKRCKALEQRCKALEAFEKRNELMQVTYTENIYTHMPVAHCPRCGKFLTQLFTSEEEETKFCPWCGQAVKWNG